MILKKIGMFVAAFVFVATATADTLEVNENHPQKYVVQKGDTLWDISAKFLKKPWYWPKIWNVNPQINDPHWIYPGDVLTLVWIDGQPYLKKAGPESVQLKDAPIPTIDAKKIKTFLKNDVILPYDDDELAKLPFVLGANSERDLLVETSNIFVKSKNALDKGQQYGVYHKGELYKDENGNKLGYKAEYVGSLVAGEAYPEKNLTKSLLVKNYSKGVRLGDYVLPYNIDTGFNLYFTPKAATVDTTVVALGESDVKYAGVYDTVILGKGAKDGVKPGDVFSLAAPGVQVVGTNSGNVQYESNATLGKSLVAKAENQLPDEVVGQAMVYRTYDKASLAIIMISNGEVKKGYKAIRP